MPIGLILSACEPPQSRGLKQGYADLSNAELLAKLRTMNGTPPEVLNHSELMQLMLPVIRADFAICDNYQYVHEEPYKCSISVYGGVSDQIETSTLSDWGQLFTGQCLVRLFPGGHFFILENEELVFSAVQRDILNFIDLSS